MPIAPGGTENASLRHAKLIGNKPFIASTYTNHHSHESPKMPGHEPRKLIFMVLPQTLPRFIICPPEIPAFTIPRLSRLYPDSPLPHLSHFDCISTLSRPHSSQRPLPFCTSLLLLSNVGRPNQPTQPLSPTSTRYTWR